MVELVLVILGCGALAWALAVVLTTVSLLRPPRLTPARAMARLGRMSPADIGLRFEELQFSAPRKPGKVIRLAAWWIDTDSPSDRTVLILHGYADSRAGALAWVPLWRELGFNILLLDLPAHGESEGRLTTAGLLERTDVAAVLNDLRALRPKNTRFLAIFGISMGAAVALATAELAPGIGAVVLDSPVADFPHGAATQLWLLGFPGRLVLQPGLWLAECVLGQRFSSIRPANLIRRLPCPILALVPAEDPFLPPAQMAELAESIRLRRDCEGISQLVSFEGSGHLLPLENDARKYKQALQQFLDACRCKDLAPALAREHRPTGAH